MPSLSVHWVLIWLNLSTSSPVCLSLCLQLSRITERVSDWLTSARLACVFMRTSLIISLWPCKFTTPCICMFAPPLVSLLCPIPRLLLFSPSCPTSVFSWPVSCPLHSWFLAASFFLFCSLLFFYFFIFFKEHFASLFPLADSNGAGHKTGRDI